MKDLFSTQSEEYARYRPAYPPELFEYILSQVHGRDRAWDCATGNGQSAVVLADYFERVDASDMSEAQLAKAVQRSNIHYHVSAAEHTAFPPASFDLITVATAYHWFNWKEFRKEVLRVGRPGGLLAIWAYNLFSTDDAAVNEFIRHFYTDIVGPFWDAERRHVEQNYSQVEFDYNELPSRNFGLTLHWDRQHFKGYLQTWSAFQNFIKAKGYSPLEQVENVLDGLWPEGVIRRVEFPLFLRLARL